MVFDPVGAPLRAEHTVVARARGRTCTAGKGRRGKEIGDRYIADGVGRDGSDLTTALRVHGANQIRRDFADARNAVGQHDEVVVGVDARHPDHRPYPNAGDSARLAGARNAWRGDGWRFGDGVEQGSRDRPWLDAVESQGPHDAGITEVDFRAPAVVQQVRRRRALRIAA